MVADPGIALFPDHLVYSDAVEAMKRYRQAQADGVIGAELESLRLLAEHGFQATTDYQLRALGEPTKPSHYGCKTSPQ